jgi:hypothetical protein
MNRENEKAFIAAVCALGMLTLLILAILQS